MKPAYVSKSPEYNALAGASWSHGEKNDCPVVALSIACDLTYDAANKLMADQGRKPGKCAGGICAAITHAGFTTNTCIASDFIAQYPKAHQILKGVTTHHPDRFKKVWANGKTYLFYTRGHVLAVKNGIVHDWTRGRAKRVLQIFEVVKQQTV